MSVWGRTCISVKHEFVKCSFLIGAKIPFILDYLKNIIEIKEKSVFKQFQLFTANGNFQDSSLKGFKFYFTLYKVQMMYRKWVTYVKLVTWFDKWKIKVYREWFKMPGTKYIRNPIHFDAFILNHPLYHT